MPLVPPEQKRKEAAVSLLREMEAIAANMRALIIAMPAKDLLGYIYAQHFLKTKMEPKGGASDSEKINCSGTISENQFFLEYVHAVLATDVASVDTNLDEAKCAELFELSGKLKQLALLFAMATSADVKDGAFGPDTADIEFHAKSSWVLLRGNRYQVLEGEFYRYVLTPHDDVLQEIYGVGAAEIATGFQDMANATRSGQADAIEKIMKEFEAVDAIATEHEKPLEEVIEEWSKVSPDQAKAAGLAIDDMFLGGIANVSRHTKLPAKLLADLAYQRGEETDFFAKGDYSGTPYRTLPARKKPLVKLGSDYYAVDPCFTRDAGYRALLFNLLQRKPDYKKVFEVRQKTMSEGAFSDILATQLPGATIHQEVYYKDPVTKQWSENDTLVLIDDVLFLVEAKAGAAATIASPALDFKRHAQSVQDLVLNAYKQCERFFNYLNSADEVPLFHLEEGKYKECGRIRCSDFRVMVPIGLTVESFSPFSAYCKELPQIEPLLGKHNFISMSIDDLFVLKRLLPTPGEFAHYMEVRQAVAGMRQVKLFDEFDHLGAYITKNRFDLDSADQLKNSKANMLVWSGMSEIVDNSFALEDWETKPKPTQEFPEEVLSLLEALDATRARGWLSVDSHIRNFDEAARNNLAKSISSLRESLDKHPARYFTIAGELQPLLVWLQNANHETDWGRIKTKAAAAALAVNASTIIGIMAEVRADGAYLDVQPLLSMHLLHCPRVF